MEFSLSTKSFTEEATTRRRACRTSKATVQPHAGVVCANLVLVVLLREIARRLRSAEDGSRPNLCALIGLELRHLHLRATHDGGNLVKRLRAQRQLLLYRRLSLRVKEVRRCLRLVEPLRLESRLRLRLLQRRLLVLREGGIVKPRDVHVLPELLCRSRVVRTRRADTLLEILRDGTVNGFLRCLSSLERGHLRLAPEFTRRKPLRELLRLCLVGKLTRLESNLRVLGDSSVLRLLRLLPHRKLLTGKFRTDLRTRDRLAKSLCLRGSCSLVNRHRLTEVLRHRCVLCLLCLLRRLERC